MLLRSGDLRQVSERRVTRSFRTSAKLAQQIPYYGQYLQMVDCQRRSRLLGYRWFQPTEMDMYMQTGQASLSSWFDKHNYALSNVDYVYVKLMNRLVLAENSSRPPNSWPLVEETLHPAPKYIGRAETSCQAGVHHMFGACSHDWMRPEIFYAVHLRFTNQI